MMMIEGLVELWLYALLLLWFDECCLGCCWNCMDLLWWIYVLDVWFLRVLFGCVGSAEVWWMYVFKDDVAIVWFGCGVMSNSGYFFLRMLLMLWILLLWSHELCGVNIYAVGNFMCSVKGCIYIYVYTYYVRRWLLDPCRVTLVAWLGLFFYNTKKYNWCGD